MHILVCSSYMPPKLLALFRFASEAANNFMHRLIAQLDMRCDVSILSYYGFPKERKWTRDVEEEIASKGISFVTRKEIPLLIFSAALYQWKFFWSLRKKEWVILYNYTWIGYGVFLFSRFWGVKTALILADHSPADIPMSFVRRVIARKAVHDLRCFDALIVLSRHLYETVPHERKLFFPGAINMQDFADFSLPQGAQCIFLYSGLLNEVTGIDLYLQAIRRFEKDDVLFLFTGRGPMEEEIARLAEEDVRVRYEGFLAREDYYALLNRANVVVNPRNMNLPENKNNFPSKVMEYLASGRNMVSTRFMYWEEFPKTIYFCDATAEGIEEGLQKAYADWQAGISSFSVHRDFAAQYDWRIQTDRLLAFLEESQ